LFVCLFSSSASVCSLSPAQLLSSTAVDGLNYHHYFASQNTQHVIRIASSKLLPGIIIIIIRAGIAQSVWRCAKGWTTEVQFPSRERHFSLFHSPTGPALGRAQEWWSYTSTLPSEITEYLKITLYLSLPSPTMCTHHNILPVWYTRGRDAKCIQCFSRNRVQRHQPAELNSSV
jgi:hypothetical protein